MAEIRELVLTFLERFPHNALPKNRKRETLDACIEDSQFQQLRQALEVRSKEIKKDSKGNKPKATGAITDEEVNILYAEALLNAMRFMNTKHFGLRGCDEHRRMKWGDVQLLNE